MMIHITGGASSFLIPKFSFIVTHFHLHPRFTNSKRYCTMAEAETLSYLPPGWTEEMYQNQTDAALEALSEEVHLN